MMAPHDEADQREPRRGRRIEADGGRRGWDLGGARRRSEAQAQRSLVSHPHESLSSAGIRLRFNGCRHVGQSTLATLRCEIPTPVTRSMMP